MFSGDHNKLRFGVAVALVAILAGCSSGNFGSGASSFGSSKLQVAEVTDIGSYTAEGALKEARGHFRNRDFGYSAAFYKRAVELRPKDAEGYVGLGASYDRLKRFDLADRVYESLYKLSGGTVQYYNNVGYSQMLRGNLKGAYESFRKARSIDPGNVVVENNLALLARAADKAQA
jgi:Flp pilus assembly protein TadD